MCREFALKIICAWVDHSEDPKASIVFPTDTRSLMKSTLQACCAKDDPSGFSRKSLTFVPARIIFHQRLAISLPLLIHDNRKKSQTS